MHNQFQVISILIEKRKNLK